MTRSDGGRIGIVDDDDFVREGIEIALAARGYRIRATGSAQEALRWLADEPCELLIADFTMPEMSGPDLYRLVCARRVGSAPQVLFVSGCDDISDSAPDSDLLAVPRPVKPFSHGELFTAVTRTLGASHLRL